MMSWKKYFINHHNTKTEMDIKEILNAPGLVPEQRIALLKNKSIVVPSWVGDLQKQYEATMHPVMTDPSYRDVVKKGKIEKMTRVILGWQKLATKRMSAMLFGIPVKRVYTPSNDKEKKAAAILESIFTKNRIDSVNLERAKNLYCSCESATIWYAQESETLYAGEKSKLKLRCKSYSPKDNAKLYPLFDEYDDMIALSIQYVRIEDSKSITYFDTYTADEHIRWRISGDGVVEDVREKITIGKIAGVYIHRPEPIWEDLSQNVYEAEWTLSRNGNYIRKNSRPTLALFSDDAVRTKQAPSGDNISRDIIKMGAGDKIEYVTWNAATESTKYHVEELKRIYFSQLQLPDVSMDNMKQTPMSGESRKMLFLDSQMKATDESGIWIEKFDREVNVVKAFAKLMFPNLSDAFDSLPVENIITPFQIRDENERITNLTNASQKPIMSQLTAIRMGGFVDDAEAELEQINKEGENDMFDAGE